MAEKIFLGDEEEEGGDDRHWVLPRDLNGLDRQWWLVRLEKWRKDRGPAKIQAPSPENPAVMAEIDNPDYNPASIEDGDALTDELAAKVLESWSFPLPLPYTPGHRAAIPLDHTAAFERAMNDISGYLVRGAPKEKKKTVSDGISASSSPTDAPAPLTESPEKLSASASSSSGSSSAPPGWTA